MVVSNCQNWHLAGLTACGCADFDGCRITPRSGLLTYCIYKYNISVVNKEQWSRPLSRSVTQYKSVKPPLKT